MQLSALQDPDPVLIFENALLYNMERTMPSDAGTIEIDHASNRRPGREISVFTYGNSLWKALEAARGLSEKGIEMVVLDLRTLRPLDDRTLVASVSRTARALVVDEGWRSGGISAEISTRLTEQAFYELDGPVQRLCGA